MTFQTRRTRVLLYALTLIWLPLAAASAQPTDPAGLRPNLVFIMTDDQGAWTIGATGNRDIHTPNLDRIFREGARFTNAYCVTPVCSPSRGGLMTSRYGTELGITDYIDAKEDRAGVGLPPETVTWPELLQQAGYRTALVGKWHLGALPQFHPSRHGYQHFTGFLGGGNKPIDPTLEVAGVVKDLKGPLPDILADDAIQFVRENRGRRFALSLHFRAPHLPYGPVPAEDSAHYKNANPAVPSFPGVDPGFLRQRTLDYYASISSVDRNVGRLLAVLDELRLNENTIVIFTSDHGYMLGHHGLETKGNARWIVAGRKGHRANMFDLSLRIPLAIRYPRLIKPGTEITALVTMLDFYPTLLSLTGVERPSSVPIRGRDFAPLLSGKTPRDWPTTLFAQYDPHNGGLMAQMRAIRTREWKLVKHYEPRDREREGSSDELYDLVRDPDELTNLAENPAHRQTFKHLEAKLHTWMQSINDPLLRD